LSSTASNGRRPAEQLEEQDRGGIDVGSAVDRLPGELLRGHILDGAEHDAVAREVLRRPAAAHLGEPEVEEFRVLVAVGSRDDPDIVGLDVAVNHTERVRGAEGGERLADEPHEPRRVGRTVREDGPDRPAAAELHGVEESAVRKRSVVEDPDRVWMLEPLCVLHLAKEARLERGGIVRRPLDYLERDSLAGGIRALGLVDGSEAAAADLQAQDEAAESLAHATLAGRSVDTSKDAASLTWGRRGRATGRPGQRASTAS
jgi:hypothetical protein